ncbi:hypothetical protein HDU97_007879 [Phlyctochytrium planicorne]|nr:hypothetical protein HDU97_007879 [Phlyctochytrium planicorne]
MGQSLTLSESLVNQHPRSIDAEAAFEKPETTSKQRDSETYRHRNDKVPVILRSLDFTDHAGDAEKGHDGGLSRSNDSFVLSDFGKYAHKDGFFSRRQVNDEEKGGSPSPKPNVARWYGKHHDPYIAWERRSHQDLDTLDQDNTRAHQQQDGKRESVTSTISHNNKPAPEPNRCPGKPPPNSTFLRHQESSVFNEELSTSSVVSKPSSASIETGRQNDKSDAPEKSFIVQIDSTDSHTPKENEKFETLPSKTMPVESEPSVADPSQIPPRPDFVDSCTPKPNGLPAEDLPKSITLFQNPSTENAKLQSLQQSLASLAINAKLKRLRAQNRHEVISSIGHRTDHLKRVDGRGGSIGLTATRKNLPKYNSCSTLFIDSTLSHADLTQTLKCVSIALVSSIRRNVEIGVLRSDDIISEKLHPLSKHIQFHVNIPTEDDVFKFLECLFQAADLSVECAVITLVYIERMLINTDVTLHTSNWSRIVLGGLVLASKVWDDHAVWNIDFCQIFPDVDVKDMNELERWYMAAIQYNVSVKASLYARYYFELRDLADAQLKSKNSRPLNVSDVCFFTGKSRSNFGDSHGETVASNIISSYEETTAKSAELRVQGTTVSKLKGESSGKSSDQKMKKCHSDYMYIPTQPPAQVI